MKNRNSLAYGLLGVLVVVGVLLAVVLTGGKSDKKSAPAKPALTLTDKAGVALTRDFNRAEAENGVKIVRIAQCQATGQPAEYACAAVVSNGAEQVCGGFLFTYNGVVTAPKNVQQVDQKFCAEG